VAQQALDLGLSGLMLEVHPRPEHALSDPGQQLTPPAFATLLDGLIFRQAGPTPAMADRLQELRDLIDQLDEEIAQKLAARMDIAERIGDHKRANQVAILQPERWERIMRGQVRLGRKLGLDETFIREFMDAIHRESIRRQTDGGVPVELNGRTIAGWNAEGEPPNFAEPATIPDHYGTRHATTCTNFLPSDLERSVCPC
jgi:chorismate mutase